MSVKSIRFQIYIKTKISYTSEGWVGYYYYGWIAYVGKNKFPLIFLDIT